MSDTQITDTPTLIVEAMNKLADAFTRNQVFISARIIREAFPVPVQKVAPAAPDAPLVGRLEAASIALGLRWEHHDATEQHERADLRKLVDEAAAKIARLIAPVTDEDIQEICVELRKDFPFGPAHSAADLIERLARSEREAKASADNHLKAWVVKNDLLREANDRLAEAMKALGGLLLIVDSSNGVVGYHLNGDVATWDEFEEIQIASTALASLKGDAT